MDEQTIHMTYRSGGIEVTFGGRTSTLGGRDIESVDTMLVAAERYERQATEAAFHARRLRALAAHVSAQQAEEAERKATQRRERAAATRARNADPFGFEAMRTRLAEQATA